MDGVSEHEMTHDERVWLIEWQMRRDNRAEERWEWEPDHNSGIWFSREAAEARMAERSEEVGMKPYRFRAVPWMRCGSPLAALAKAEVRARNVILALIAALRQSRADLQEARGLLEQALPHIYHVFGEGGLTGLTNSGDLQDAIQVLLARTAQREEGKI